MTAEVRPGSALRGLPAGRPEGYRFGGYATYWPEFIRLEQAPGLSRAWQERKLETRKP